MRSRPLFLSALLLVLAGCEGNSSPPRDDDLPPDLPTGTVRVGPNMFMVPLQQKDGDGCTLYRRHSPGQMVTQEIQYRKADGSFTVDKREADCMADDS